MYVCNSCLCVLVFWLCEFTVLTTKNNLVIILLIVCVLAWRSWKQTYLWTNHSSNFTLPQSRAVNSLCNTFFSTSIAFYSPIRERSISILSYSLENPLKIVGKLLSSFLSVLFKIKRNSITKICGQKS